MPQVFGQALHEGGDVELGQCHREHARSSVLALVDPVCRDLLRVDKGEAQSKLQVVEEEVDE
eukprot:142410-Heterocapsa_arctica.AAC.1